MGDDKAIWDELLLSEVGVHMEVLFVLNAARDKEVWQYVVGVTAHLEYVAGPVLWIEAGRPTLFPEYEDTLGLGQAAHRIGQKRLLEPTTVANLQAVAGCGTRLPTGAGCTASPGMRPSRCYS